MLTHLDLFSGIGGFSLAAEWAGFKTIGFVEKDDYCQKVLKKHWPDVPIVEDIRDVKGIKEIVAYTNTTSKPSVTINEGKGCGQLVQGGEEQDRESPVTLITGGFPCQSFSVAGKRRGKEDDRYLWPEMFRIIAEVRPRWVLAENVTGIIGMALDTVLSDLDGAGYTTEAMVIPACAVNASHRRDRVWIMAYARLFGQAKQPKQSVGIEQSSQDVADTKGRKPWKQTQSEGWQDTGRRSQEIYSPNWWAVEPDVGRSLNGFPDWLDRHIGRGMSYEESTRAVEILRTLWRADIAETLWQTVGGFDRIQQAEILFAIVCQYKTHPDQTRLLLESKEALEGFVRGLWMYGKLTGSPSRPTDAKQPSREHTDPLQELSRLLALNVQKDWQISCWEDGLPRVVSGVKHRVDRLRCLGNAIVPQVAYEILRGIAEIEQV